MERKTRARWWLFFSASLALGVLIALGVALAVNSTGEATSARGTPQAHGSAIGLGVTPGSKSTGGATSEDQRAYQVTIEGNGWDALNGTWEFQEVPEYGRFRAFLRDADGEIFARIAMTRMREDVHHAEWEKWLEVEWPGEKWLLVIHKMFHPNGGRPTGWVGQVITDPADAEPYQYAYGPYDGGTVVVHKR